MHPNNRVGMDRDKTTDDDTDHAVDDHEICNSVTDDNVYIAQCQQNADHLII